MKTSRAPRRWGQLIRCLRVKTSEISEGLSNRNSELTLFAEHQPLNGRGPSGELIAANQQGAHARVAPRRLELARHPAEETLDNQVLFDPDNAVIGPAHPHIGLVRCAVW